MVYWMRKCGCTRMMSERSPICPTHIRTSRSTLRISKNLMTELEAWIYSIIQIWTIRWYMIYLDISPWLAVVQFGSSGAYFLPRYALSCIFVSRLWSVLYANGVLCILRSYAERPWIITRQVAAWKGSNLPKRVRDFAKESKYAIRTVYK